MCGITGVFGSGVKVTRDLLVKMTDIIKHRGPDAEGFWINENENIGFGHRRLSILDLSSSANQPMCYDDGDYVITYNGEIYNYLELRRTLIEDGFEFKTNTDTEVILALFKKFGIKCLEYLDGMFAFVIYCNHTKLIYFARDRFGEKPLYYSIHERNIYFSSEIKSLFIAGVPNKHNSIKLYNYLEFNDINGIDDNGMTYFNDVLECKPAHYIVFEKDKVVEQKKYWDLTTVRVNHEITESEAVKTFYTLLINSVKNRLISDVEVGSSLSGGLDSSTIVNIINNSISQNQKTFSARFKDFDKDESYYIDLLLESKKKIVGFSVFPDGEKFKVDLEKLIYHQEEPFGSASQYNQFCVMRLAHENNVKVLLDGQGADEILGGYLEYYFHYLTAMSYKKPFEYFKRKKEYNIIQKNHRNYKLPKRLPFWLFKKYVFGNDLVYDQDVREIMLNDSTITHLPSLLRYGDKNSMAFSTEVRLPFLDHKLVEFVFSLPLSLLLNSGWTKFIMRKSFANDLPNEICWRVDKIGFEPPQKKWMVNFQAEINEVKKNTSLYELTGKTDFNNMTDWKWLMISKYFRI